MNLEQVSDRRFSFDLNGSALVIPALRVEPLPVRAIAPAACTQACPAGVQVKAYISLIAEERFEEALEVVRRRCPLPGICGRVCHHPCEAACLRNSTDEPVSIRALKRFVADREREFPRPEPPPGPDRPFRVAVIGSGPAGLTAAYDLRLAGFPVSVFEAEDEPGGMLRYGITSYRLPRNILSAEIDVIRRAGVDIRTGQRLGSDMGLEEFGPMGFDALLLATGAQIGRPLGVPGEDGQPAITDALTFLRRVNAGDYSPAGRKVVVIGGGSTAIETARASLRLGSEKVTVLYRRSRDELLAGEEEVEAAENEGIEFHYLVAPLRFVDAGDGRRGLECVEVGLRERDDSGRRQPVAIPGSEFFVETDRVLAAVGQTVDFGFLTESERGELTDGRRIAIDPATAMTGLSGVFAAGDMVTGPATVIDAIAAGHRAAESIRHFMEEGKPDIREQRPERRAPVEYGLPDPAPNEASRLRPEMTSPAPGREFAEVEQVYTAEQAVAEARRCQRCGPCGDCRACASTCQRRHILVRHGGDMHGSGTAMIRTPAGISLALEPDRAESARLLPAVPSAILPDIDLSTGQDVELLPVRTGFRDARCRACGRCIEVCQFGALSLQRGNGGTTTVKVEPALCRGCNLCASVCPTDAAAMSALSPEWWGNRMEDAVGAAALHNPPAAAYVVVACQRRAGALDYSLDRSGIHVETVRFRCVGQITSGMLMNLVDHGAKRILVAGCTTERCRFGAGASLAMAEVDRSRSILASLGRDGGIIAVDWSPGRAMDRLEDPIASLIPKLDCGGETPGGRPGGAS